MTEHLLSLGHRRIGLMCGAGHLNYVAPRVAGSRLALEAAGVAWDEALARTFFYGEEAAALEALLTLPAARRPTALFCFGDDLAAHTIQLLAGRGIRVPADLSVSGFNDDGAAIRCYPSLTTVRQPYAALGEAAVDQLLAQITDISTRGARPTFPIEVIASDSTTSPAEVSDEVC